MIQLIIIDVILQNFLIFSFNFFVNFLCFFCQFIWVFFLFTFLTFLSLVFTLRAFALNNFRLSILILVKQQFNDLLNLIFFIQNPFPDRNFSALNDWCLLIFNWHTNILASIMILIRLSIFLYLFFPYVFSKRISQNISFFIKAWLIIFVLLSQSRLMLLIVLS